MSAYIKYKFIDSDNTDIIMHFHKYTSYIVPVDFMQYTFYCINYNYRKCDNCGIELLTGLEEIVDNYKKIVSERYFINKKLIDIQEFSNLTCDEVMIKIALE